MADYSCVDLYQGRETVSAKLPGGARWGEDLIDTFDYHLDRRTDDLIRTAEFGLDEIETGYMKGPKPWTFMYQGSATI